MVIACFNKYYLLIKQIITQNKFSEKWEINRLGGEIVKLISVTGVVKIVITRLDK